MKAIKDREYGKFTPIERINLAMAALVRGDLVEADRCWDTCPKYDYKALDFDFTIRMHAVMMLRMEFREKCFYHYNSIKLIEAHMLHFECFIDNEYFEDRMGKLVEAHTIHLSRLKAAYNAIKQFCSDVGLCQETFLKNCHIEEHCNDLDSYLARDMVEDVGLVSHYKKAYSEYWKV